MNASVSYQGYFSAAHRLFNPAWSEERNEAVFGLCNNPHYHGHTYRLIVTLSGEVDAETGWVYSPTQLESMVVRHVISEFEKRNLNLEIPSFQTLNPTAENIAYVIWGILRPCFDMRYELQITLYETERNMASYPNLSA